MMRYKLLLTVMAFMLSCNFISGLGASSGTDSVDYDAPADPLNVTVELNEDETTIAVIPPEGGELTLTSADGSVYTLEVPAGALLADTEISMTAIGSLEGGPVESNVYGVQLEPSGLALYEFATLTIQPSADIPLEEQFYFKYEGDGTNFHHAIVDPYSEEIRIKLLDFSGGGLGQAIEVKNNLSLTMENMHRLENQIGKDLEIARKSSPSERESIAQSIDNTLKFNAETLLKIQLEKAKKDCKYLAAALDTKRIVDTYRKQAQELLYGDDLAPISGAQDKLLKELQEKCPKAFNVSGTLGPVSLSSVVCDINKPFTINATGPDECQTSVTFSGGYSGRVEDKVTCPLGVTGTFTGPYGTILSSDGGGTITGSVTGHFEIPLVGSAFEENHNLNLKLTKTLACK